MFQTANVLLDAAGTAKVADFGTVRENTSLQKGSDQTHASTKVVVGTKYYMPPEYQAHGHCSEKTDAYGKCANLTCSLS